MSVQKTEVLVIGTGAINANTIAPQITSSNNSVSLWISGTTYALGNVVEYSGSLYRSLQNSNTGNTPATSGTAFWECAVLTVADGDIVLVKAGSASNILQRVGGVWTSVVSSPLVVALMGNQASPVAAITYNGASLPYVRINYTVMTALGREREGEINILNDGSTTVQYRHMFNQIGTPLNVIFSVAIAGGNVSLNYTSVGQSTPITLKYTMTGWY